VIVRSAGAAAAAATARGPLGVVLALFCGGTLGGIVGGRSACELGRCIGGPGIAPPAIGPGGMCGMPYAGCGGEAIGPGGGSIVAAIAGVDAFCRALPQLRQNFMPGGFSPRHTLQTLGGG
jgi:hypothetical protein